VGDRLCSKDAFGANQCEYCGHPLEYGISLEDDGVFTNPSINYGITNFDNTAKAMLTVFQVITMDGWTVLLYNLMDTSLPPVAAIYFCLLIVFGSFFLLNLILAVIMESFIKIQAAEIKDSIDNNEQGIIQDMIKEYANDPANMSSTLNSPQLSPRESNPHS